MNEFKIYYLSWMKPNPNHINHISDEVVGSQVICWYQDNPTMISATYQRYPYIREVGFSGHREFTYQDVVQCLSLIPASLLVTGICWELNYDILVPVPVPQLTLLPPIHILFYKYNCGNKQEFIKQWPGVLTVWQAMGIIDQIRFLSLKLEDTYNQTNKILTYWFDSVDHVFRSDINLMVRVKNSPAVFPLVTNGEWKQERKQLSVACQHWFNTERKSDRSWQVRHYYNVTKKGLVTKEFMFNVYRPVTVQNMLTWFAGLTLKPTNPLYLFLYQDILFDRHILFVLAQLVPIKR